MSQQFEKTKPDSLPRNMTPVTTEKKPNEETHSQDADRHRKVRHPHSDKE